MCCKSVIEQFRDEAAVNHDFWSRRKYIADRTFGFGYQQAFESPGHFICARDRVCLKCNHTSLDLEMADRYIPCLDEMEPVDYIRDLPERQVEALEAIALTLKHKDFSTDTSAVLREAKEHAAGLFRGCKRK